MALAFTQKDLFYADSIGSGGSATSNSWTPSAGTLYLLAFQLSGAGFTTPTVTGNGLTWVNIANINSGSYTNVLLYRAMGNSPSTGVLTVTLAGGESSLNLRGEIMQVAGTDTSGTNGSGAIVQVVTGTSTGVNSTSISITMTAGNGAYAGFGPRGGDATATPRSGWTLSADYVGSGGSALATIYRTTTDTAAAVTWGDAGNTVAAAVVELKVGGAVATKLGITTQASSAASAQVFPTQPVIAVQDAGGSTVVTATNAVTASIASGTGTLGGTTTVNAVAGVATFTNLTITGQGEYTLAFAASGLTGATGGTQIIEYVATNESTAVDARLCGAVTVAKGTGNDPYFRLNVTVAGNYVLSLALGRATHAANAYCRITQSNGTAVATIGPTACSSGQFVDATGVKRTSAADWVSNQATLPVTVTGTSLQFHMDGGGNTSDASLAHVRLTPVTPASI